jgi:D-threonate/D-erythronate kinase
MKAGRVAIVADDLTGALDAAAPFAARGADTRVVIDPARLPALLAAWEDDGPEVVAVTTESRHLDAEGAADRVAEAAASLARWRPVLWFKKLDSTLRGQVVAECLAMRRATGRRLLLAPAVPAQGRRVRDAEVWVEGLPLARSPYAADARSPSLAGPLDAAFAVAGRSLARHDPAAGTLLPSGDCVADADSDDDLRRLVAASLADPGAWLLAGAGGLAAAIAERRLGPARSRGPALPPGSGCLYVLGSRSPRALAQRARLLAAAPGLEVAEALAGPRGPGPRPADVIVPGDGVDDDPEAMAAALAETAAEALDASASPPEWLFLTGGDTALAVLRRLGVTFIVVEGEWRPGVVMGRLDGDTRRGVVTKAGGFGDADLLERLHHGRVTTGFALPDDGS